MSVRLVLLVGLVAVAVLPPGAAGDAPATDRLSIHYTGGGAASGAVAIECDAYAVTSQAADDTPWTIRTSGGTWSIIQTQIDQIGNPAGGGPNMDQPPRAGPGSDNGTFAPGTITIRLLADSDIWIFGHDADAMHPFALNASGDRATWTPLAATRPTTTWYAPGLVGHEHHSAIIGEETRVVAPTNGTLRVGSELTVLVRHATISLPERTLDLPPQRTTTTTGPGQTRETLTDAWLHIPHAEATIPAAQASAMCGGMKQTVRGDISWQRATGAYQFRDKTTDTVDDRLVTTRGMLTLTDQPAPRGARVDGTGTITLLAEDLTIQHAPADTFPGTTIAGAIAFVVLGYAARHQALAWAAVLYTRIQRDSVLDHPQRARLMDDIDANPGTNLHAAANRLGVSRSVLRHHVETLVRSGLVRRLRLDGENLLVSATYEHAGDTLAAIMEAKPPVQFLAEATRLEPVLRRELVERLSTRFAMTESGARKWITRAEHLGILTPIGTGHGVHYRCSL